MTEEIFKEKGTRSMTDKELFTNQANFYESTNNTAEPKPLCSGFDCSTCVFMVVVFDYFGNPVGLRCTKK